MNDQCIKTLKNVMQHCNIITSSKMLFTDKDAHLTKTFQQRTETRIVTD